ncbi:MAG: AbrB/MazE/SpoVT family DNA-binding domain-containing protein [Candidatus Omnitrophica bacterium]|nr:AbrB/MazE/SpoVT family DNA-binding domain-containing protein [Candidatus Omnitrophota bacterium]
MPKVTITEKGEVPLPAAVRKRHHLEPGARVVLTERDNDIVLSPDPHQAIDRAYGMLRGPGSATKFLLEQRDKDLKKEDDKIRLFRRS